LEPAGEKRRNISCKASTTAAEAWEFSRGEAAQHQLLSKLQQQQQQQQQQWEKARQIVH
jgi:hypothetical protein